MSGLRISTILAAGVLALSAPALAQQAPTPAPQPQQAQASGPAMSGDWGAIAGTAAIMSDYVFRGVSQTREGPALQGALEYTKEFGMFTPYAGVFLSNTRFPDTVNTTQNIDVPYEFDITAGVRGTIGSFGWDLGYIKYYYPQASLPANNSAQFDWTEVAVKVNYDFGFAKLLAGYYYSKNYSIDAEKGRYMQAGVDVPLPYDVTLAARIGKLTIDDEADFGLPDYKDWSLGVSRTFEFLWGGTLALTYYDTDIKRTDTLTNKSNGAVGTIDPRLFETAEPRVVLSFTKTF